MTPYDLLVIGGGVNGAGIARDAAGRGLSVLLCEKDDLAQGKGQRSPSGVEPVTACSDTVFVWIPARASRGRDDRRE